VLTKLRNHLTYANVVSTLCLFILLGGSAVAAVRLSKNSVSSTHIKNGQVKRADLAANGVDSSKVDDGSLLSHDFAPGQVPRGEPGPQGERGPQGDQGPQGEQGLPGSDGQPGAAGSPAASALFGRMGSVEGTRFGSPSGTHTAETTESAVTHTSPNATIIARDLSVKASVFVGIPGSTGGFARATFTLRDDGVDTAVTCSMLNSSQATSTAERSCNSGQATATIAPGSDLSIKVETTVGLGATVASVSSPRFGWRATTP
jgi:Collagen triple helix repeat (20 copies)